MNTTARMVAFSGALLALLAVILGALGSHFIDKGEHQGLWDIASNIHLFNAAALIGLAALLLQVESAVLKWGARLIILGTVLFSGSIYLHVVSGYTVPGLTPLGGFLMMVGWFRVVLTFVRKS